MQEHPGSGLYYYRQGGSECYVVIVIPSTCALVDACYICTQLRRQEVRINNKSNQPILLIDLPGLPVIYTCQIYGTTIVGGNSTQTPVLKRRSALVDEID